MEEKEWSIGNGQICINAGKDLIVIPDYYSSTVVDCKVEGHCLHSGTGFQLWCCKCHEYINCQRRE